MLKTMSQYHYWAYEQLYTVVDLLDDEKYHQDLNLFFYSVHGSLNHLLLAEKIWFGRFTDSPFAVTGLGQELCTNKVKLKQSILLHANKWIDFIEQCDPQKLVGLLHYKNTRGEPKQLDFETALFHVFNHGTHHRGQISTALTQLGQSAPVMDLLYFIV